MDKTAIRHASSVILVRDAASAPSVLMGQRGAGAAFMPSKYVFPGGAVDAADGDVAFAGKPAADCLTKLAKDTRGASPDGLLGAAVRELWEETGLRLGRSGQREGSPAEDWAGFYASGAVPDASALSFLFRAITPPGRPRRFDARFFLAPAEAVMDDPDDFSRAADELSHLHWVPLTEARALDLPFITEVVLAEVSAALPDLTPPETVPFFSHDDHVSRFLRL